MKEAMATETERKPDEDEVESPDGVGVKRAREILSDLVLRAGYGNERIALTRHGKQVAFLIGARDFERLRALDASTEAATSAAA